MTDFVADHSARRVVYTAIFGDYDRPCPIQFQSRCDFVCFTDDRGLTVPGWNIEIVKDDSLPPPALNRKIKLLPHLYLQEYQQSLYVDGNISIKRDPANLFDKYLKNGAFIAIPAHPYRNCVYDEAQVLLSGRRLADNLKLELKNQIARYHDEGVPPSFGLTENNVILRSHHNEESKLLCELWWKEYMAGCSRDQIALPYAIWTNKSKVEILAEGPRRSNRFFDINLHTSDITNNPFLNFIRVARFRTGQSDLNGLIGSAIDIADRIRNRLLEGVK